MQSSFVPQFVLNVFIKVNWRCRLACRCVGCAICPICDILAPKKKKSVVWVVRGNCITNETQCTFAIYVSHLRHDTSNKGREESSSAQ